MMNAASSSSLDEDSGAIIDDDDNPMMEEDRPNSTNITAFEQKYNEVLVHVAVTAVNKIFEGRPFARFYALETVARVPYFAYLSVLHLYETFGLWRQKELLKLHFDQSYNEAHHLRIMEELGGSSRYVDRWAAQHAAVMYFAYTCVLYLVRPAVAYHFNALVERHAYETYDNFLRENETSLKQKPPTPTAVEYYEAENGEFVYEAEPTKGKRKVSSLFDVFELVRDDELEHFHAMSACQSGRHNERKDATEMECGGVVECVMKSPTGVRDNDDGDDGER